MPGFPAESSRVRVRVFDGGTLDEGVELGKVHDHRVDAGPYHGPDRLGHGGGVDLLVNHMGRNEDEVAGACLGDMFQTFTPAVPGRTADHVQDGLLIAVVMRACRRARPDGAAEG